MCLYILSAEKLIVEPTVKSLSMGYFRFNQLKDNQNLLEVHRFSLSRHLRKLTEQWVITGFQ